MKYQEFIDNILNTRGRFAINDEYHERHHIIPRCMHGSNEESNLIDLYAREHFIAHKLLMEENPKNERLVRAFCRMCFGQGDKKSSCCSAEEYEYARKLYSTLRKGRSPWNKGKKMTNNYCETMSKTQKGKHHTEQTKAKLSASHKSLNTWIKGRCWYNDGVHEAQLTECPKGWKKGRLYKIQYTDELRAKRSEALKKRSGWSKGRHWFTDGFSNVLSYECPTGYHAGKTNHV